MEDLDDFETVKPPPFKKPRASISKEPSNKIFASPKWSGSQLLSKIKSQSIEVVIEKSSNFVADFKLPGDCFVCVITEADYIGDCKSFRLSLAKFYKSYRKFSTVVICVRTEAAISDFAEVQSFCVIELGLPLIPIADLDQIPQLLTQLILTEPGRKKVNPFKFGLPKDQQVSSTDKNLIKILESVPGLGDKKSRHLLEHLPSLQQIVQADQDKLKKILGPGPANAVWSFFHHEPVRQFS